MSPVFPLILAAGATAAAVVGLLYLREVERRRGGRRHWLARIQWFAVVLGGLFMTGVTIAAFAD